MRLFRPDPQQAIVDQLYGAIVAQSRHPAFYSDYGVPDTVNGRFEMVLLHTLLFVRRMAREPEPAHALGQGVFDAFCNDMDASLREMGIGDLGVPRQMRRVAEAFYGRQRTFEQALAGGNEALVTLLGRVFAEAQDHVDTGRLAHYMKIAGQTLDAVEVGRIADGDLGFPDPGPGLAGQEYGHP